AWSATISSSIPVLELAEKTVRACRWASANRRFVSIASPWAGPDDTRQRRARCRPRGSSVHRRSSRSEIGDAASAGGDGHPDQKRQQTSDPRACRHGYTGRKSLDLGPCHELVERDVRNTCCD